MIAGRDDINHYIPQREPFIAIHTLEEADEKSARTQFEVERESIFVSDGKISEAGLIENIAQTAAAQMGYICRQKGLLVPIGYLGSVKNLIVYALPETGTIIETTIRITNTVMGAVLLEAGVYSGAVLICTCEMRVFIKNASIV